MLALPAHLQPVWLTAYSPDTGSIVALRVLGVVPTATAGEYGYLVDLAGEPTTTAQLVAADYEINSVLFHDDEHGDESDFPAKVA